ncbi:hypothetical protein Micbo1qcDRAFT_207159 [Microdochium bolleyi]|uniref:Uncharacterized protein n=1 Tax=Microdochium bolleyi TaxID=196109 RepID=A0A136IUE2_9PEZI|nr:hypothetical protein Micbo1qcDRAFT_207159 [Microdochium bolleyi]
MSLIATGQTWNMSVADLIPEYAESAKGSKFCVWGPHGCANLRAESEFIPGSAQCSYCRNTRHVNALSLKNKKKVQQATGAQLLEKLQAGYRVPEGHDLIFCCHPGHLDDGTGRSIPSCNFRPREPYPCEDHRANNAWRVRRDVVCDACKGNRDPITGKLVGAPIAVVGFVPSDYFNTRTRSKKLDWWYAAVRRAAMCRDPRLLLDGSGDSKCGLFSEDDLPMQDDIKSSNGSAPTTPHAIKYESSFGFGEHQQLYIKREEEHNPIDDFLIENGTRIQYLDADIDMDMPDNTSSGMQENFTGELPATFGCIDFTNPNLVMNVEDFPVNTSSPSQGIDTGDFNWRDVLTSQTMQDLGYHTELADLLGPNDEQRHDNKQTFSPSIPALQPHPQQHEQEQPTRFPLNRTSAPTWVTALLNRLVDAHGNGIVLQCPCCGDEGPIEQLFRGFTLNEFETALRPDWALCLRCNEAQPKTAQPVE